MKITSLVFCIGFALGASFVPYNIHTIPAYDVVRLSYYWPDLGGTNCHESNWRKDTNKCVTNLYGKPWQHWENKGAACPVKYPLGTKLWITRLKKTVVCVDRGGGIVTLLDGTSFLDLLQRNHIWVPDWKERVLRDTWCPSGCYWSTVIVVD